MNPILEQWIENCKDQIASIEIEFDAYFKTGELGNYYHLEIDEVTNTLSITIFETTKLPNHIVESLKNAVHNSKPKQI